MTAVMVVLGLWWCALTALLFGSALLALLQPKLAKTRAVSEASPAVSVLVPLRREEEAGSEANLALSGLEYADFEVLFSVRQDERLPYPDCFVVLQRRNPHVVEKAFPTRLILTTSHLAINPKLANLIEPVEAAHNDLLLIKDAAIRLAPKALAGLVASLTPGVGLVCAVPIARRPRGLIAHVEAALINLYGARLLLALGALGGGAGIGAAMLLRRGDLKAAGGIEKIANAIADDHAIAKLLARQGLRTIFAAVTVDQHLGIRRLAEVWRRHRRWALCRRLEEPLAFFAEPLTGLLAAAVASLGMARSLDISYASMLIVTILLWPLVETSLAVAKGWPVSWWTPVAILLRELAQPALWLGALLARRIVWGSVSIPVRGRRR